MLLLGEIDLSVGSVSGLAAAMLGVACRQRLAARCCRCVAAIAGRLRHRLFYGALFTRFGVPSFVITLAGLLGFLGLQLYVLGKEGSINLPFDSPIVEFAQPQFLRRAGLRAGGARRRGYVVSRLRGRGAPRVRGPVAHRRGDARGRHGGPRDAPRRLVLVLNRDRGVPWMFVLFVALVVVMDFALRRTSWGRSVIAVGGNVEAARRAGINVRGIYLSVFVLCSTFAALGGILAAARLASANQSSGGGDINLNAIAAAVIGGTSLFGGRGSAYSALLGIIVIQSISNGLTLLNLDSSLRYMVTGGVLLIAVTIDSLSRRSRAAHGRA